MKHVAVAIGGLLALLPVAVAAQTTTTNCYNIGQTVSCTSNTTPAPDYQAQQEFYSEAGAALGLAIREAIERHRADEAQTDQAISNAIAYNDCDVARQIAGKNRGRLARIAAECHAAPPAAQAAPAYTSAEVQAEIAAFAANPAHPYFGLVREQMGQLLKEGRAGSLQEAYDFATAASPTVQQLIRGGSPAAVARQ